jgi:outer membrane lipoprotein SlyB
MSGSASALMICTIGGAVIGATIFGVAAGVVGGTVGYAADLLAQNRSQYEFKVKSDNQSQILTVTQYSGAIPLKTIVRILEKNGTIFVRKN